MLIRYHPLYIGSLSMSILLATEVNGSLSAYGSEKHMVEFRAVHIPPLPSSRMLIIERVEPLGKCQVG